MEQVSQVLPPFKKALPSETMELNRVYPKQYCVRFCEETKLKYYFNENLNKSLY